MIVKRNPSLGLLKVYTRKAFTITYKEYRKCTYHLTERVVKISDLVIESLI